MSVYITVKPSSSYTSADKQRSSIGYVNESDEVVYRTKKKRISDEGLLHEKDTERTIEAKANRAQEREHSHVRDYAVSIETKSRSSENRGDETLPTTLSASSMKKSIYRSSQSTSSQFQSGEEKRAKQTSVSAVTSPPAFDIYASPAIVDVHPNNSSILSFESDVPPAQSQSAPALMSPIEIDIYNFSKTYNSNIDQNTQLVSLEDVDRQTDEVVLRRKPGISTNEINESEPLQRHNAMRSRKNRSGVAFTDTEKSDIITNVEQTQVQTPAEATSLRKKQHHVSDEVRLQVNEAKLSMEENIAKAEKTEKFLDEMDINPSSKMIRCRSLENIKGTKLTTDTSNGKDYLTKSENMSSMPATSKTGTKESQLDVKSENKRKNKSATTSTDKSEFKIAYVKKKAKKAKVFLKEKLTYHHSNVEHSKEYRADDGNNTAVFYISESSTTSLPNKPATPSTQQQKPRTKTTQIDDLRGQVKEVTNIMRTNVDEIAKRGEKLEDLETRSGHLEDLSNSFATTAAAIQTKMKRRNRKVICVIAITITVILVIVTVILLVYFLG